MSSAEASKNNEGPTFRTQDFPKGSHQEVGKKMQFGEFVRLMERDPSEEAVFLPMVLWGMCKMKLGADGLH